MYVERPNKEDEKEKKGTNNSCVHCEPKKHTKMFLSSSVL